MPGSTIPTNAFPNGADLTGKKGGMWQPATGPVASPNLPLGMTHTPTYTSLLTKQYVPSARTPAGPIAHLPANTINTVNPGAVRGAAANPSPGSQSKGKK